MVALLPSAEAGAFSNDQERRTLTTVGVWVVD